MVAHLDIRAIGTSEGTSMLDLSFRGGGLINPSGAPIPADIVDGAVTINSSEVSGPAAPAPGPSHTLAPGLKNSNQSSGQGTAPALPPATPVDTAESLGPAPMLPAMSNPNNAGGSGGGGTVAPPATPGPVTGLQTQGNQPSAAVPTPTLTAPADTSGLALPVSPDTTPATMPDTSIVQRLEFSSTAETPPAPPAQSGTPLPDPPTGFPWWSWLLIGLGTVAAGIWGGIFYTHLKGRGT